MQPPLAGPARPLLAVFPSILGVRLARRMPETAFYKIMDKMAKAEGLDDARRTVEISKLTNRLKSDLTHQYMAPVAARRPAPSTWRQREMPRTPVRDDP